MRLFHVSDNPDIEVFEPRLSPSASGEDLGPVVWAIDDLRLPHYLLPRECPRVCWSDGVRRYVAVEDGWSGRIRKGSVVVYEFATEGFELADKVAGYYVSRAPVVPVKKTVVPDLVFAIKQRAVDLKAVGNLWPLRDHVLANYSSFSFIRMRNARPLSAAHGIV